MQWKALAVAINITEFIVWGYQRRADDAAAVGSCGFQTCCRERELPIIIIKTMFAVVGEITPFEKPMKRNFN